MELFFDTETSDMYKWKLPPTDNSQPWIVQVGAILSTEDIIYSEINLIVYPDGRTISLEAGEIHNISPDLANEVGIYEPYIMNILKELINNADLLVCHNYKFDMSMLKSVWLRGNYDSTHLYAITNKPYYCTMEASTNLLKLSGKYGKYKWPKLSELYRFLFNEDLVGAHDAMYDVRATRRCYYELMRRRNESNKL